MFSITVLILVAGYAYAGYKSIKAERAYHESLFALIKNMCDQDIKCMVALRELEKKVDEYIKSKNV